VTTANQAIQRAASQAQAAPPEVWIDQAKTFQVDAFNEQYLYCVTALFAGECFANDSEVVAELHAIGQRHANFTQAIQAVPPEVWERLETALEQ